MAVMPATPAAAQLTSCRAALYSESENFFYGPAANDEFAHALAVGDFNADGADDLVTGIPFDDNAGDLWVDSGIAVVRYGVLRVGLAGGIANHVLSQANGGTPDPGGAEV